MMEHREEDRASISFQAMLTTRVAVIGAGAAGLNAARVFSKYEPNINVTVFEKSDSVGGTWNYTDDIGRNKFGDEVHSSLYKNLRTNLCVESMAFPDFEFRYKTDRDTRSFPHHSAVFKYLKEYCEHFDLEKYIRFSHRIDSIEPDKDGSWKVTVTHLNNNLEKSTSEFDAVVVCVGRYSKPAIPHLEGQELFENKIIHSHDYKCNENYSNQTALIIGAGPSGTDIAFELSHVAKKVYLCHKSKSTFSSVLPKNVTEFKGNVLRLKKNTAVIETIDGNTIETQALDCVMFCTGYSYNFDFIKNCNVSVTENSVVSPLYKHLIHIDYPRSLFFVGIPHKLTPFILFHYQNEYIAAMLRKEVTLPTKEEMVQDGIKDMEERTAAGLPYRYAHAMVYDFQWKHFDELAKLTPCLKPCPNVIRDVYDEIYRVRHDKVHLYRDRLDYSNLRGDNWPWKGLYNAQDTINGFRK